MQARMLGSLACVYASLIAPGVFAQSPTQLVSSADAAYTARQYHDAISLYKQVVASILPDDTRAHAQLRIGYAFERLGETEQARQEWQAVANLFPAQPLAAADGLIRVGYLSLRAKDYAGARAAFERVSKDYAGSPEAVSSSAEAICLLGKVYLHLAEAEKAAGPAGEDSKAAWDRASAYFELSREAFERVVAGYQGVGDWAAESQMQLIALKYEWAFNGREASFDDVITAADSFLTREFSNDRLRCPTVLLLRAESHVQKRRFAEAIPDLLEIRENFAATAGPALGTARYFLARCYEETNNLEKAEAEYLALLEAKEPTFHAVSDHAAAEFGLANIHRKQGRFAEAGTWYGLLKVDHPNTHWSRFADEALAALQEDRNK